MSKKLLIALVCAVLSGIALTFVACAPASEHVHEEKTLEKTLENKIYEITVCEQCEEELNRTLIAQYIAPGLTSSVDDSNVITVKNKGGLKIFNTIMVNSYVPEKPFTVKLNKKFFSNKTVVLENDVDLTGYYWSPIDLDDTVESLTLDGKGNKITGLTLEGRGLYDEGSNHISAMFGLLSTNLTVKNITFEGANLSTKASWSGFVVGRHKSGLLTCENLAFTNCKINGSIENRSIRLGTIVGHCRLSAGARINVTGCSVSSSSFKGYHNVCALIGTLDGAQAYPDSWSITDCSVTDNEFIIGTSTPKFVNPYTCDPTYLEREAMEEYVEKNGMTDGKVVNSQSGNRFEYGCLDAA